MSESAFHSICLDLGECLREREARLITVESCTGGGVANAITEVAGSSDWFDRSLVTYSNQAKTDLALVSPLLIEQFGAVSVEVAEAMATGGLQVSNLDSSYSFSIAITGVAGPGGGSPEKPVGLVCFAWGQRHAGNSTVLHSCRKQFDGDRTAVRQQSILFGLDSLFSLV